MYSLRVRPFLGVVTLAFCWTGSALAGNWQNVIAGKSETIEIDKVSIVSAASSATAWSRISLDRAVKDPAGAFDAIHVQNHYDCKAGRFTTLRRAYFSGDALVREGVVSRHRANLVQAGSIDERLFKIACQTAAVGDMPGQSDVSGKLAAETREGGRPAAIHADMRSVASDATARGLTPVADTSPVAPAEKPKLIVLPPIDKAAAQAAASSGQTSSAPKPGAATAPPAPVRKSAASGPVAGAAESAADSRRRELHYANSGPPRGARKKLAGDAATTEPQRRTAQKIIPWSYEGEGGPGRWATLRGDYATCATGKRQSPIDIREGIKVDLEVIKFDYRSTQFRIIDDGRTVQVNVGAGLGLTVMGKRYELQQFHFHRPAEERVDGRSYDMSVHLVHRNDEGQLAVVAVLLEKGNGHPLIQTLWNNLPLEHDIEVAPQESIDPATLLPENRAYWTYMGSLTTPPCSEGVLWMVLKQPVQVAPDQVAIFSRVYQSNARPVQAANGRLIKESR